MWQAMCWHGKGYNVCWRPGTIAENMVTCYKATAPFTPIRYCTE